MKKIGSCILMGKIPFDVMAAGIYVHWRVHCRDLVGSKMSSYRQLSRHDFWV
jgi:hypothetical protein